MPIICSVDYTTALAYKGMNLTAKYNNKKQKVYLRVDCTDDTLKPSIDLARISKNIIMLRYNGLDTNSYYQGLGSDTNIYIGRFIEFGNDITEEDVARIESTIPPGVVPVIVLPSDFKDLYSLWKISKLHPRVRFSGGSLFSIEGVKVGAVGIDILDKLGIKYDLDSYTLNGGVDVIEDVDINTLDIDIKSKSKDTGNRIKSTSSTSKKKVQSFAGIFSSFQLGNF